MYSTVQKTKEYIKTLAYIKNARMSGSLEEKYEEVLRLFHSTVLYVSEKKL